MNHKWLKRSVGTFDDGFFAFYQIQDIHTVVRMVCHRFGKPVAAGFDEFIRVQPCSFFSPAVSFGNLCQMVGQMLLTYSVSRFQSITSFPLSRLWGVVFHLILNAASPIT